jgi:hypothetical protein
MPRREQPKRSARAKALNSQRPRRWHQRMVSLVHYWRREADEAKAAIADNKGSPYIEVWDARRLAFSDCANALQNELEANEKLTL